MQVLVLGATGSLGQHVSRELSRRRHVVRAASREARDARGSDIRWVRLDLTTGEGTPAAVEGVQAVIDAANVRSLRRRTLDAVHVAGTARVLEACQRAGDVHYVGVSIVGVDEVRYPYYAAKVRQERTIESGPARWTLLRATQFHQLVDQMLRAGARLPVLPLPTDLPLQPIDAAVVAGRLVDLAEAPAAGRVPEIGGPRVQTLGELADDWMRARARRRRVVPVPLWGRTARSLSDGVLCSPSHAVPGADFRSWLEGLERG